MRARTETVRARTEPVRGPCLLSTARRRNAEYKPEPTDEYHHFLRVSKDTVRATYVPYGLRIKRGNRT